ncbi:UDP-N-acetylmuramoyl-L-alanine--D-glutamate ligase [Gemella sp. zg-570]|uniref:UDP-N-acetylmuramoyl-L-alanine--D-glutamate ligase n=1 Tax=Gemella sp. zg-570 TaxID=2840371 RepID=UPI001C0AB74A|nr:UDP-N-acetylmuramoyl-L-alanine--D-glutamate ligase [Gemella sp. zg-570]QWQ39363.1 UDP-N-acetylmuramoyl-L-alanine--D-glutamate ligase [Gemella sp. zg-570]
MNIEELEKIKNKVVLVLGFARSGYKTALVLTKLGVKVVLNASEDLSEDTEALSLEKLGVKLISGGHHLSLLDKIDLIVKNPGIPYNIEILETAKNKNIPIITEIELTSLLFNNRIIGITGTNGKTTTAKLIYEMLSLKNKKVKLAGNIGFPAIEVAYENGEDTILVTEISSFQLNGTEKFKPYISLITNLGEAHLDYHGSKENYQNIKKRIFKNQDKNDFLVLNIQDKNNYEVEKINANIIYYSSKNDKNADAYVESGWLKYKNTDIFEISKVKLPGQHNLENIINATIVAILENVSIADIQKIVYNFIGVEHRLQYIGDIDGVKYYNDSKATNPVSTLKALSGFERNVILIAGGKDRGINFQELASELHKVKLLICFGESKNILINLAKKNNIKYIEASKVDNATIIAFKKSENGDTVLLSPACASWDQYKNFEVRGQEFIDTFNKIKNKELN